MSDRRDEAGFPNRQAELQFQYDARYHERLRAAPWLKALQSGRALSNAVGHIYFDTPDKELQRHGVMLRVDRKGKGAPALPPLSQLRDLPEFRTVLSKRVFDSLAPVFSTRIKRTTRCLKPSEGAEVALAFERLEVSANSAERPVGACELTLASNDPHALYRLGRMIAATAPVRLVSGTDASRAYALLDSKTASFVKATPVELPRKSTGEGALIATLHNCLAHLSANEECAMAAAHPEGVHQMRVALRRLDALFSVYRELVPQLQRQRLQRRIRHVAHALGPARDWDVFIDDLLGPVAAAIPSDPDLEIIRGEAERERMRAYRDVRRALAAPSYTELRLDLAAWAGEREWRQQPVNENSARLMQPAERLAEAILESAHRKVLKRGKQIETMGPRERHKLRIRVKKLRYAAEFFAPLYATKRSHSYIETLRELQDDLGRMNDVSASRALIEGLHAVDPSYERRLARAGGIVTGWHVRATESRERELARGWRAFTKAKTFWR